jgi:uncharacterized membrane protein
MRVFAIKANEIENREMVKHSWNEASTQFISIMSHAKAVPLINQPTSGWFSATMIDLAISLFLLLHCVFTVVTDKTTNKIHGSHSFLKN